MKTAADILKSAETLVIKVGTALVVDANGERVRDDWLSTLAQDIKTLKDRGKNIVIVSSGGVALGRKTIGVALDTPPQKIPLEKKQAASSVGQFHVFNGYHKAFEEQGLALSQVLLTMFETENRRMHLNARATLKTLLDADIIPVINENDVISTEEIRFGDNDRLAARVAQMIEADTVILLSTTDGLYTANPEASEDAEHIPFVETITDEHMHMAGEAVAGMSTGGMKSKLQAAQAATNAGIYLLITNGMDNHCLQSLKTDKSKRTTLFFAQSGYKNAKKRWIGSHLSPKGVFVADSGAVNALKSGKSLLPVGVISVKGEFERGDIVEIHDESGQKLGMGVSAYNHEDASRIIGKGSEQIETILGYLGRRELIHRNDMVLVD